MPRFQKQLIYGLCFLLIFAALGWGAYSVWERGRGNCFDGVLSRNETGIDCGGACAPCVVAPAYQPLRVAWSDFYPVGTSAVYVAGEVENPNADYGVSHFPYAFQLFDGRERVLQTIRGEGRAGPGERVLVYGVLPDQPVQSVGRVALVLRDDVRWEDKPVFVSFSPRLVGDPIFTLAEGGRMTVEGSVENVGGRVIPELHVVAVLRDEFGFRLLVAGTSLSRLAPFSKAPFRIEIPPDARLAGKVRKTKIFLYPEGK